MEKVDDPINEKPKGNMLQNENREDEATPEDLSRDSNKNIDKREGENIAEQSPIKNNEDFDKK